LLSFCQGFSSRIWSCFCRLFKRVTICLLFSFKFISLFLPSFPCWKYYYIYIFINLKSLSHLSSSSFLLTKSERGREIQWVYGVSVHRLFIFILRIIRIFCQIIKNVIFVPLVQTQNLRCCCKFHKKFDFKNWWDCWHFK